MPRYRLESMWVIAAVAAATSAATPGLAQSGPAAESSAGLEEIIVTARKRNEALQDVPLSISAFSAESLQERGLVDLKQLSRFTPGFYFSDGRFGRDQDRPTMRGMTNLRPETQQVVALFIDGVYVRGNISSVLLDNLERVEVVKGPQSALYGRATFAGAINYITKDAPTEFEGEVTGIAGQNELYDVKAQIGGPILGDRLRVALAARHYEYGGAWENSSSYATGREVGNQQTRSATLTLSADPTDALRAKLLLAYSRDEDGQNAAVLVPGPIAACGPGRQFPTRTRVVAACGEQPTNIPTAYNFEHFDLAYVPGDAGLDRETLRANLLLDYALGDYSLSSISGWSSEDEVWGNDTSYDPGPLRDASGRDARFWSSLSFEELEYWSTELRLSSPDAGRARWLVGASWYQDRIPEPLFGLIANLAPGGPGFEVRAGQETKTWGVYGQFAFDLTERVTTTLEARYFEEDVQVFGSNAGRGIPYDLNDTFDWVTPRLTIDYEPTDGLLFYAQAARGAKAGGFNATPGFGVTNPDLLVYQPETLWSYELGAKTSWLDRRLTLNGAVYFIDWKKQQIAQLLNYVDLNGQARIGTVVGNAGATEIRGLEAELNWRPTDNLELLASYAWNDAEFTQGTDSQNLTILGNANLDGLRVPQVPRNTATIGATLGVPALIGNWAGRFRTDVAYASSRYDETQNLIETGDELLGNVSAALVSERLTFTLYVNNVFDEDSATNVFRFNIPETNQRTAVVTLRRPREAGVRFDFRF